VKSRGDSNPKHAREAEGASRPAAKRPWLSRSLISLIVAIAAANLLFAILILGRRNVPSQRKKKLNQAATNMLAPKPVPAPGSPRPAGTVTFSKEIAPIVWNRCAPCHRPGQAGPFSLLSYAEVKRQVVQIADVTAKGIMPPWPPDSPHGTFAGDRRLLPEELALLQQWISEGGVEGNPSDLPPAPQWPDEWFLGQPDLIVQMPEPFVLPAEGRDLYRNFVIPIPTTERRYVRAVELRPGNSRVVHHCFMFIDETGQSRRLDGKEARPGTPPGTKMPEGQFLSYQPGRLPAMAPEGLAWTLEKGSSLLLQMHLTPTGKPETLQATIGLYFTDRPPAIGPVKLGLTSLVIDIPAGKTNHLVTDSFKLPVDLKVLAVLAHAHYLAKEMKGFATLPDGGRVPLLHIKNWNFDWQGDYRFARPLFLPKGSILKMEYTYDNSTNNVRNPNSPPKQVTYGEQSSDEMAELWFQVLVENAADRAVLIRDYSIKTDQVFYERSEYLLQRNPADAKGHFTRALILLNRKQTAKALEHFNRALEAKPDYQEAYFTLGVVHLMNGNLNGAKDAFENAIRLDPGDYRAHGSLGNVFLRTGRRAEAIAQFETALRINPNDSTAKENLESIRNATGRLAPR
jgi:hypothetical protein